MQKRRFAPSPALVVSLIALFVALGGTSYAAITALPKNSVGTKQLKNGAVTAGKISSSAAGTVKVVGQSRAPAYASPWGPSIGGTDESVRLYKDAFGIVHLQGNVSTDGPPNEGTIFTLPAGDRPAGTLYFSVYGAAGSAGYVEIDPDGQVISYTPQSFLGLSNITFRAGT